MNREIEIDLVPIFKAVISKLWLMILIGAIFAGIAFGATKVIIKPTYRCSFTAYVNNQSGKDSLTQQDINADNRVFVSKNQQSGIIKDSHHFPIVKIG